MTALVAADLGRCSLCQKLAVVQDDDTVADPHHGAHVVVHQQDRRAELLADAPHDGELCGDLGCIQAGQRFIEAQQHRTRGEGDRDAQHALVAVRQGAGRQVQHRVEPQQRGGFPDPLLPVAMVPQRVHGADQDVVVHRHVAQQAAVLERAHQSASADRGGGLAGDVLARGRSAGRRSGGRSR